MLEIRDLQPEQANPILEVLCIRNRPSKITGFIDFLAPQEPLAVLAFGRSFRQELLKTDKFDFASIQQNAKEWLSASCQSEMIDLYGRLLLQQALVANAYLESSVVRMIGFFQELGSRSAQAAFEAATNGEDLSIVTTYLARENLEIPQATQDQIYMIAHLARAAKEINADPNGENLGIIRPERKVYGVSPTGGLAFHLRQAAQYGVETISKDFLSTIPAILNSSVLRAETSRA